MELNQDISNSIKNCLVELFNPTKILIFGSYANGTATQDSDVDIFAIVPDGQNAGREAIVEGRIAIRKALRSIGKNMAFDLILDNRCHFEDAMNDIGTIQFAASKQGYVLYEQ